MDLIAQWFKNNLDIIFFIYGLAFFVMGISILAKPKKGSVFKIADILWLLACFGLVHGINEWLDMWTIIKYQSKTIDLVRLICLIISFMFLFEFGKRLFIESIYEGMSKWQKEITRYLSWAIYLVLGIIILFISISEYADLWKTGSIWARYLLGFPGAFLTGISFFSYYRHEERFLKQAMVKHYFFLSGLAFILYGVLSGLVVPKADFFPSNWLNNDSFFSIMHIPVQVFRTLLAIIITLSVNGMIEFFEWENKAKLEKALVTDQLTGIYNRHGFFTLCEHLLKTADRQKIGIFMLYADLDNMKRINDTWGHQEGDLALIDASKMLTKVYRESDIIARIGGDEFVVIPVGISGDNVEINIDRLEKAIELHNLKSNRKYQLSISAGIAFYDPANPCSINELLDEADKSMYERKRNRRTLYKSLKGDGSNF